MGYYEDLGKRNQALRDSIFPSNVGGIKVKRVKGLKVAKREAKTDISKPAVKPGNRPTYSFNPDRFVTGKRGTVGAVYGD